MSEPEVEPVVRRRQSGDPRSNASVAGRSTRFKVLTGLLAVVVLIGALVGGGALWGLWSFRRIDRVKVRLSEVKAPSEPFNVLVVGSDSRANISKNDPSAKGMLGKDAPSGQRSDSLMVARVDLANERIDLLSIPRDLWLPIAGKNKEQRINTAYATSAQTTVDTIEQQLGIPINHFAEVDFSGFRSLINALGGVPMYFGHPVKDTNSGLNIPRTGCTVLDGEMGLAFARSRHLQWYDGKRWRSDGSGDLGRMTRQQLLTRASAVKAQSLGLKDVTKLKGLIDAAAGSVKLDSGWGAGDLLAIARKLSDFDPQRMQTHGLPVVPTMTSGGASIVKLDETAAGPVLNIFRGKAEATPVTTTTAPPPKPSDVSVRIVNSSAPSGEGRRVSYVLAADGFGILDVTSGTEPRPQTVITHAPGQDASAQLVAGWLSPTPEVSEDKNLAPGQVVVDLGSDFKKIAKPDHPNNSGAAVEHSGTPTGRPGSTTETSVGHSSSAGNHSGSEPTSESTVPPTTTTTEPGWTPGTPPQGTVCR